MIWSPDVTFVPSAAQKKSFGGLPNGVVGLNATLKGTNFANRRRGESWVVSRMPDSRGDKRQRDRIRVAHVAGRRRVVTARQQSPSAIKERVPAGYDELVADVPEKAAGLRRRADLQNDRLRRRAGGFAPVEDAVAGLSVVDAAQGTQFRKFVPSEASDDTEEPIEESAKCRRARREARRGLVSAHQNKRVSEAQIHTGDAADHLHFLSSPRSGRPPTRPPTPRSCPISGSVWTPGECLASTCYGQRPSGDRSARSARAAGGNKGRAERR
jgi:hypothetical protein